MDLAKIVLRYVFYYLSKEKEELFKQKAEQHLHSKALRGEVMTLGQWYEQIGEKQFYSGYYIVNLVLCLLFPCNELKKQTQNH
jgi:hypothetical protein